MFEAIRDETPKMFVKRLKPNIKIKKKCNKWYVLFENVETIPFVKPNTNYRDLWMDAMDKIINTPKQ
jgi:hypothetical protein